MYTYTRLYPWAPLRSLLVPCSSVHWAIGAPHNAVQASGEEENPDLAEWVWALALYPSPLPEAGFS